MEKPIIAVLAFGAIGIILILKHYKNKKKLAQEQLNEPFPELWRKLLEQKVLFYKQLNERDKNLFEKRVQLFITTKNIEGVETEVDDAIRLMVASSAVIPTFAFPEYNYPNVQSVLIYPNSFDKEFQTERYKGHKEFITGLVDGHSQNSIVILSKPDLNSAFDGLPHKENVGIHEFVHLLDKEDGVIDGIPELLLEHRFIGPWLHEIKKEIDKIEKETSDINPYGLTNNAEFLAVVSEYFFNSPQLFQKKHSELYQFLSAIFNRDKNIQKS